MVEKMDANMDPMPCADLSAGDFEQVVLRSPLPVLVEFWAPWSRPCRVLDSELGGLGHAFAGRARFVRVNADDNPDLSLWYGIQSIPTLLFFFNGIVQSRVVGTVSRDVVLAKLDAIARAVFAEPPKPTPS
jgi:thioredoxin-like negative regulator of GroEL